MNADRPSSSTRLPAVAGSFYPSDPQELRDSIGGLLSATPLPEAVVELRLLIVPHAGYAYSGPVAATAYRLLQALDGPRRVVVVGPSHFVHFFGLATPGVENFTTPLGVVPVDADLTARAEFHSSVGPNRTAHEREHSIEVQLPFLQVVLKEFTVVALLTGSVEPTTVAEVLGALMDDEGVVGLVSSDLSHYLDHDAARVRDERTARTMMEKRPEQLARGAACGLVGVQAALLLARQEGWACSLLDLRSSGDTAGGRDAVVGYGAFAIGPLR